MSVQSTEQSVWIKHKARRIYQLLCFEFEGFNFPFYHSFLCYFRQLKCRGLSYFRESIECIYMCWKNRSHKNIIDGKYHPAAHALYWLSPCVAVNHTELTHLSLLLGKCKGETSERGPRAEGSSHHCYGRVIPVPPLRHSPVCVHELWACRAGSWHKSEEGLSGCGCLVRAATLCYHVCQCECCFRQSSTIIVCSGWSKKVLLAALTNSSFHRIVKLFRLEKTLRSSSPTINLACPHVHHYTMSIKCHLHV